MIEEPDRWAPAYAEAGAGSVTFHVEAAKAPVRLARELRAKGARASMALKPATPVEPYADVLGELDMLLIMTVEPGFGGQKFLDLCLPKIRRARELISAAGSRSGSRSTAVSRPRPSSGAPTPGRTSSWPARRCSPPTTRTRWCRS
jgi:ribulose-phosphate 3-epimerase